MVMEVVVVVMEVVVYVLYYGAGGGNVGYNCCQFVVILSSSLPAVKSLLVGDV